MDEGWETVAITIEEGGEWIEFRPCETWKSHGRFVHAIKFANGEIWDAVNGWRPRVEETS